MADVKFTPGHWDLRAGGAYIRVVGGEHRTTIADGIANEANANLIAASPDLYDALGEVIAAMRKYEMDVDAEAPAAHREMMRKAYAALAKAEGRS